MQHPSQGGFCGAATPGRAQHAAQDADATTRAALVEFSYRLALGRPEEAFRAVAAVRSMGVWQGMAHMAIKSKRLDVAGGWACGAW
jgi:hypothetical protein